MTGSDPNEGMRDVAREVLSEFVRGLLGDAPADGRADSRVNGRGSGDARRRPAPTNDDAGIVPAVPAPPVAAVLRPSTWSSPAAPGEVIGDRAAARASEPGDRAAARASEPGDRTPARASEPHSHPSGLSARAVPDAIGVASDVRVEPVTIDTDEDLARFVHALVTRAENARDRLAIRSGRLRFALHRSAKTRVTAGTDPGRTQAVVRIAKGAVTERVVREAGADGARLVLARGVVLTPLARDCAGALGVEIERERKC